jgi:hypothetical protein
LTKKALISFASLLLSFIYPSNLAGQRRALVKKFSCEKFQETRPQKFTVYLQADILLTSKAALINTAPLTEKASTSSASLHLPFFYFLTIASQRPTTVKKFSHERIQKTCP